MSARKAAWCTLAAAVVFWTAPARSGPWLPAPGEHYSALQAGFYSANSFHGADGNRVPFAFGVTEERRSVLSYSEIGWKKTASVILGIPVESVTRTSTEGVVNRTDTGVSDLALGLKFKMADGPSAAALEVTWYPPAGYNRKYLLPDYMLDYADATECAGLTGADSINCVRQMAPPRLGAGEQELAGTIHWGMPITRFGGFVQASSGYLHRSELAGQALLNADLGFWLGQSFLVAGRYRGAIDVGHGKTPADEIEEHLAGPVLLFRLDEGMDVFYTSLHTAAARNAIHADRFYVGVSFRKTALGELQGYLGGPKAPKPKELKAPKPPKEPRAEKPKAQKPPKEKKAKPPKAETPKS